jgi:hypothetical protein
MNLNYTSRKTNKSSRNTYKIAKKKISTFGFPLNFLNFQKHEQAAAVEKQYIPFIRISGTMVQLSRGGIASVMATRACGHQITVQVRDPIFY